MTNARALHPRDEQAPCDDAPKRKECARSKKKALASFFSFFRSPIEEERQLRYGDTGKGKQMSICSALGNHRRRTLLVLNLGLDILDRVRLLKSDEREFAVEERKGERKSFFFLALRVVVVAGRRCCRCRRRRPSLFNISRTAFPSLFFLFHVPTRLRA